MWLVREATCFRSTYFLTLSAIAHLWEAYIIKYWDLSIKVPRRFLLWGCKLEVIFKVLHTFFIFLRVALPFSLPPSHSPSLSLCLSLSPQSLFLSLSLSQGVGDFEEGKFVVSPNIFGENFFDHATELSTQLSSPQFSLARIARIKHSFHMLDLLASF